MNERWLGLSEANHILPRPRAQRLASNAADQPQLRSSTKRQLGVISSAGTPSSTEISICNDCHTSWRFVSPAALVISPALTSYTARAKSPIVSPVLSGWTASGRIITTPKAIAAPPQTHDCHSGIIFRTDKASPPTKTAMPAHTNAIVRLSGRMSGGIRRPQAAARAGQMRRVWRTGTRSLQGRCGWNWRRSIPITSTNARRRR